MPLVEVQSGYVVEIGDASGGRKVIQIFDKKLDRPLAPIVVNEDEARELAEALIGQPEKS